MKTRATFSVSSTSSHTTRCRDAGFTLLEIMVAMVLLVMIVTTAFGTLRLGERSWEAGLERASEAEKLRTVTGMLQRIFSQALPLNWSEKTKNYIAFSGDNAQLRFIAPAPLHHGATGLFEYTLVVEAHNSDSRLVMYYRLHDPDSRDFDVDGSDSQRVELVDNLKTASFAYYGSPLDDDQPQWHSQWSMAAETFPRLVRARIISDDEQRQWPELLLALRVDQVK